MNTVYHSAFSTAEHHFNAMINRIQYYNDMSVACSDINARRIYRELASGQIKAACDLVDLCYCMDFMTRTEAFNIKHWLYWYDDPDRLDPANCFFEDFRYE